MLNELLEFKAYVTDPESETPRVQPYLLTDYFDESANLIGIEHIMTMIARAFIFSNKKTVLDEVISQEVVDDTIDLLHRWTGFEEDKKIERSPNARVDKWMKKNSVVDGWLKKYWMFQAKKSRKISEEKEEDKDSKTSDEKAKTKSDEKAIVDKLWDTLEKKWNERLNSGFDYSANMITYNNIIANALEIGPLKNMYFIVKKDSQPSKKTVKENKRFKYLTDKSRRHEASYMKIMKIIAAYLLNLRYHPECQKEVWIKNVELANWYGLDDGKNGSETFYPKNVTWNEKPIYTTRKLIGNYTKLLVDQEYLNEFDFQIIDAKDVDKYKETHWVLEDLGHKLVGCWGIK